MGSALSFHVFATPFQPTHYRILALDHRVLLAAEGSGNNPVAQPWDEGMPRCVFVNLTGWY